MPNESHLDAKYFVDAYVYNCPFCKRGHVTYHMVDYAAFDWTEKKRCHAYTVRCASCRRVSLHLSWTKRAFEHILTEGQVWLYRFKIPEGVDLDAVFFYSVPSSFFILDDRIPRALRELFSEAEGCLKGNFLTGASACARKVIYEMALHENVKGDNWDERIKAMKQKYPSVDPTFFDTLLTVQVATSTKVHEGSYDAWNAGHLRLILATLSEVLHEVYVEPRERKEKRARILKLKDQVVPQEDAGDTPAVPTEED